MKASAGWGVCVVSAGTGVTREVDLRARFAGLKVHEDLWGAVVLTKAGLMMQERAAGEGPG